MKRDKFEGISYLADIQICPDFVRRYYFHMMDSCFGNENMEKRFYKRRLHDEQPVMDLSWCGLISRPQKK